MTKRFTRCYFLAKSQNVVVLKLGQPQPLFVYFRSLQTNIITFFTTDQCEKMSCPSSIYRRDSNPQPLECEPPPTTTRPGLPLQGSTSTPLTGTKMNGLISIVIIGPKPFRQFYCCDFAVTSNFTVN